MKKRPLDKIKTFILQNFVGYAEEAILSFHFLLTSSRKPPTKFVIFGRGRSGSTLLVSLLNSNPDIHCDGEILSRKKLFPEKVIQFKTALSHQKIYGFKLLSYQIRSVQQIEPAVDFIEDLHGQGYKFIYLYRENLLRHVISKFYANFKNKWHSQVKDKDNKLEKKLKLDLNLLYESMEESERLRVYETELMSRVPHLKLSYENDLSDPEKQVATMDKIADFLNCSLNYQSANLKKNTPSKFSDFIENYDEMHDFLANTKYSGYLSQG